MLQLVSARGRPLVSNYLSAESTLEIAIITAS